MLNDDQRAIRDAVRDFVAIEITPHAATWDQHSVFPRAALQGLSELGCLGVMVPEALGGAGLDARALALILEEIAAGDGATSTIVSVHNCPVCSILLNWGNDEQQLRWLNPLASGQMLGAFALTEPQAGSDASHLQTRADREGDDYLLNGTKQFITSGQNADLCIIIAVTDMSAGKRGFSAFAVPTDTPGYHVDRLEDKMGQRASDTAQIRLENCRVSSAHRIGLEGMGYKVALSGLEGGRIGIAAQAVGMARAALDTAIKYAHQRHSFGKAIFQHQALQFRLADCATRLAAARQLVWHAASLKDAGESCLTEAAMAKLFASETAQHICAEALQTLGGYGYMRDFPVERIARDVRVTTLYEGTSDVQRLLIARSLSLSIER